MAVNRIPLNTRFVITLSPVFDEIKSYINGFTSLPSIPTSQWPGTETKVTANDINNLRNSIDFNPSSSDDPFYSSLRRGNKSKLFDINSSLCPPELSNLMIDQVEQNYKPSDDLDIVFLFDRTGSTAIWSEGVKESLKLFINTLTFGGTKTFWGLGFAFDSAGTGRFFNEQRDTTSFSSINNWVDNLSIDGSKTSFNVSALDFAIDNYSFNPSAEKIFILITDISSMGPEQSDVISAFNSNPDFNFFGILNPLTYNFSKEFVSNDIIRADFINSNIEDITRLVSNTFFEDSTSRVRIEDRWNLTTTFNSNSSNLDQYHNIKILIAKSLTDQKFVSINSGPNQPIDSSDFVPEEDKYFRAVCDLLPGDDVKVKAKGSKSLDLDIGFLVDTSGSMSGEINNLRTQLADYANQLINDGFNVRFSGIGFESTNTGSWAILDWTTDTNAVENFLDNLNISGGDEPTTDVISNFLNQTGFSGFRSNAQPVFFYLGDERGQTGNVSLSQTLNDVQNVEPSSVFIVGTSFFNDSIYAGINNETGGTFKDINSFSSTDLFGNTKTSIEIEIILEMTVGSEAAVGYRP